MTDRDVLIERGSAIASHLDTIPMGSKPGDGDVIRALISLASPKEDAIGAAEGGVGQWVYRRIEVLMDAEPGTPEGTELAYLAAIAADVEEYGATGDHPVSLASPSPAQTDAIDDDYWEAEWQKASPELSLPSPSPAQMDLCNRDGQPCLVGRDTDDAHWRCGTVACGAKSSPSQAQWPEDVVGVVQLYNIPELLDELNGRQRSCVDGREIVAGKYHDASVAADKLRAALATLPPPEDERVKGLIEALQTIVAYIINGGEGEDIHYVERIARSALASYRGGA